MALAPSTLQASAPGTAPERSGQMQFTNALDDDSDCHYSTTGATPPDLKLQNLLCTPSIGSDLPVGGVFTEHGCV